MTFADAFFAATKPLMLVALFYGSAACAAARAADAGPASVQECGWSDSARAGPYLIQNDVWGPIQHKEKAADPDKFAQCIDAVEFENDRASARFHWAIRNSGDVVSYPHIQFDFNGYGGRPGPISIDDLSHRPDISAYSSYAMRSTEKYNVSYDIWLKTAGGTGAEGVTELMIWLDTDLRQNTPSVGSVTVDGNRYQIYQKFQGDPGKQWKYVALVADQKINNARISISGISLKLAEIGVLNGSDMISSVQFGAELTGGDGVLTITNFDIAHVF